MKNIYTGAWILLTILFVASVLTGYFNPLSLVVFSLVALTLVFALALWVVMENVQGQKAG